MLSDPLVMRQDIHIVDTGIDGASPLLEAMDMPITSFLDQPLGLLLQVGAGIAEMQCMVANRLLSQLAKAVHLCHDLIQLL